MQNCGIIAIHELKSEFHSNVSSFAFKKMLASSEIRGIQTERTFCLNREEIKMVETNAKHNIVTAELEQVKKIEIEIAGYR